MSILIVVDVWRLGGYNLMGLSLNYLDNNKWDFIFFVFIRWVKFKNIL